MARVPKKWLAAALAILASVAAIVAFRSRRPSDGAGAKTLAAAASPLPGGVRTPDRTAVPGARLAGASVVVITVDTLRRDHLAPYGASLDTPAASRLAREGVVFERAVSQVPLTLPSHSSIFTGLYPPRHAVHDNGGFVLAPELTTLAERLSARGYDTAAFVAAYVLHSRWGIAQGHQTYDDTFDYSGLESRNLSDLERPGAAVVDRAVEWLGSPRRRERPFHLWVHLFDPHEPYAPPPEYRRRAPTAYAGEVMYADSQAARLLAALDARGLRGRTVVAYLADHGESLGEHGEATHGIFLYGATLDVPLIVAPPPGVSVGSPPLDLAGRRARGIARLVDVTPTLLDLVGLPVPADLDGTSLLPLVAHEAAAAPSDAATADDLGVAVAGPVSFAETYYPRFHYSWSELFAVETARWKYVRAPRPELYDVLADPKQLRDVSSEHPRVAATLAAALAATSSVKPGEEPRPAKIDKEALERLQALGYVGGTGGAAARRSGPLPDPKDKLPLLQELVQGQALRDEGRLDEAARRLEALVREEPDNPAVHLALSSVYFRRKDAANAAAAARRAVELNPDSAVAVLDLAFAYQAQARVDEAVTGFERVLELDPENLKALVNLAEIQHTRGEREKALGLYERAAAVAPRFALVQVNRGGLALELGRSDLAADALAKAVALGAAAPGLHFNLGVLAEQRGRAAVAAREYRAEVEAHPEAFKAWVNLGLLERQAGRVESALAAFQRAAGAGPTDVAGPYLMAETLAGVGRRVEAERWAKEARRRAPGDPRVQQLAARVLSPRPR